MESLYRLKDLLCDQVDEIVAKNDITPTELDRVYKVVDVIKDICTIDAMENAAEDEWDEESSYAGGGGYSGRRGGSSRAGRSGRGSYEGGYSGRRGRYSRAGRSYRGGSYEGGGYSGRMSYDDEDMSKEHMMQKVAEMQRQIEQM